MRIGWKAVDDGRTLRVRPLGRTSTGGGWVLLFFLSLTYASCAVFTCVGLFAGIVLLSILAAVGLIAYSLVRTFIQTTG
jgi:hypothetical protein